jgi:hypothetical protein
VKPQRSGKETTAVRVEAEGRLTAMRQGKKVFLDGFWPGDVDGPPFKMAVLSCTEVGECRGAAFAHLVSLGLDPTDGMHLDLYYDEVATQILYRAMREPADTAKRLASDAKDLRDAMSADERSALFDAYSDFRASIDPAPETLSPALLEAMVEAVKKKDKEALLAFGGRRLAVFLLTGGLQLPSSPTGKFESASSSETSTPS